MGAEAAGGSLGDPLGDSLGSALVAARWLGERGVALWLIVGLTICVVVWLVGRGWGRGAAAHVEGRRAADLLFLARPAAGLSLVLFAVGVFAVLASALGSGRWLGRIDDAYAGALRAALSPASLDALTWTTHLGDTLTLTVIGSVVTLALVLSRCLGEAFVWVVAVGGQGVVTRILKAVFERVRPEHDARFAADGYSFPSGHAAGATVVYGMLAYLVLRLAPPRFHGPALLVAAALAWTTGFSRIALQVHHLSDVVAGFASGGLWLAACIAGFEVVRCRTARARSGRVDVA